MEGRGGSRPRILVVTQDFPWPVVSGSLIRLTAVMDALAELGDIDLFSFVSENRADPVGEPDGVPVRRFASAVYRERGFPPLLRARWLASQAPIAVVTRDFGDVRAAFESWRDTGYNLVWFSKAHTYEALGRPRLGPTVVDLDDLEDQKIRASVSGSIGSTRRARGTVGTALARVQSLMDAARWTRLQRRIAGETDAVVVCSEIDARRLGVGNARVVPNGYPEPARPLGASAGHDEVVLFAGLLPYPPNLDAARWLAGGIAPRLRALTPDVRVRLVGTTSPQVLALHRPPLVEVVGRVPSMDTELATARVVAVPVRFGSGTRVKILEAFAHRIPVVSTALGAEGLDVVHGRHLLVADDESSFAEACARLLDDRELAGELTEAAHELYLRRHSWSASRSAVRELGASLVSVTPGRAMTKRPHGSIARRLSPAPTTTVPGPDVLVVGSARSGTTLVQRLLCELPGVVVPPETHFFDIFVPELLRRGGPPYNEVRLRREIEAWLSLPQLAGTELDIDDALGRLGGRCDNLADLFAALLRAVAPDSRILGEKTPNHLHWWMPLSRAFPDCRWVAVVRDPRAVVASTLRTPWGREMFHPRWGEDLHVALAVRWRVEQELVEQLAGTLGDRCLLLRYEDVVRDPHGARSLLARHVGAVDAVGHQAPPLGSIAHPWETWKVQAAGPITSDRGDAWRRELAPRQQRVVTAVCAARMRRLGYPISGAEALRAFAASSTVSPLTWRRARDYGRNFRAHLGDLSEVSL